MPPSPEFAPVISRVEPQEVPIDTGSKLTTQTTITVEDDISPISSETKFELPTDDTPDFWYEDRPDESIADYQRGTHTSPQPVPSVSRIGGSDIKHRQPSHRSYSQPETRLTDKPNRISEPTPLQPLSSLEPPIQRDQLLRELQDLYRDSGIPPTHFQELVVTAQKLSPYPTDTQTAALLERLQAVIAQDGTTIIPTRIVQNTSEKAKLDTSILNLLSVLGISVSVVYIAFRIMSQTSVLPHTTQLPTQGIPTIEQPILQSSKLEWNESVFITLFNAFRGYDTIPVIALILCVVSFYRKRKEKNHIPTLTQLSHADTQSLLKEVLASIDEYQYPQTHGVLAYAASQMEKGTHSISNGLPGGGGGDNRDRKQYENSEEWHARLENLLTELNADGTTPEQKHNITESIIIHIHSITPTDLVGRLSPLINKRETLSQLSTCLETISSDSKYILNANHHRICSEFIKWAPYISDVWNHNSSRKITLSTLLNVSFGSELSRLREGKESQLTRSDVLQFLLFLKVHEDLFKIDISEATRYKQLQEYAYIILNPLTQIQDLREYTDCYGVEKISTIIDTILELADGNTFIYRNIEIQKVDGKFYIKKIYAQNLDESERRFVAFVWALVPTSLPTPELKRDPLISRLPITFPELRTMLLSDIEVNGNYIPAIPNKTLTAQIAITYCLQEPGFAFHPFIRHAVMNTAYQKYISLIRGCYLMIHRQMQFVQLMSLAKEHEILSQLSCNHGQLSQTISLLQNLKQEMIDENITYSELFILLNNINDILTGKWELSSLNDKIASMKLLSSISSRGSFILYILQMYTSKQSITQLLAIKNAEEKNVKYTLALICTCLLEESKSTEDVHIQRHIAMVIQEIAKRNRIQEQLQKPEIVDSKKYPLESRLEEVQNALEQEINCFNQSATHIFLHATASYDILTSNIALTVLKSIFDSFKPKKFALIREVCTLLCGIEEESIFPTFQTTLGNHIKNEHHSLLYLKVLSGIIQIDPQTLHSLVSDVMDTIKQENPDSYFSFSFDVSECMQKLSILPDIANRDLRLLCFAQHLFDSCTFRNIVPYNTEIIANIDNETLFTEQGMLTIERCISLEPYYLAEDIRGKIMTAYCNSRPLFLIQNEPSWLSGRIYIDNRTWFRSESIEFPQIVVHYTKCASIGLDLILTDEDLGTDTIVFVHVCQRPADIPPDYDKVLTNEHVEAMFVLPPFDLDSFLIICDVSDEEIKQKVTQAAKQKYIEVFSKKIEAVAGEQYMEKVKIITDFV